MANSQKVPGPGSYSSKFSDRPTSPNYKMGTDHRRPLSAFSDKTPGPGTYKYRSTN